MDRRIGKFRVSNFLGYGFVVFSFGFFGTIGFGLSGGLESNFVEGLRSRLTADYGRDSIPLRLKALGLSIFNDLGLLENGSSEVAAVMTNPVPTATPLGGVVTQEGESPTPDLTATSEAEDVYQTQTATWAVTPTPTATFTPTATQTSTSTPTPTPTPTKTPTASKTVGPTKTSGPTGVCGKELCPVLICVQAPECQSCVTTDYVAYYDYENVTNSVIEIPLGGDNHFYPAPEDRDQPTRFVGGHQPNESDPAFSVAFDGQKMKWWLNGVAAWADSNSPECGFSIQSPTVTPKPTETPVPTIPTPEDVATPSLYEGILDPAPVELTACEATIFVNELGARDPAYSSGIDEVKLKYNVADYTGWIYSDPLEFYCGGWTGDGDWDGCYRGSIELRIDPNWTRPETGDFIISLHARALDNVGYTAYREFGTYSMPAECGITPPSP